MTAFVTHPACLQHLVPPGHLERPQRLAHLVGHLEASGLMADMTALACEPAAIDEARRVHDAGFVDAIERVAPVEGFVLVDRDTPISPGSLGAALACIGAARAAVDWVLAPSAPTSGSVSARRAFCALRPPGHHAEESTAMGFCLFNTVAIAADMALERPGIERVAILDFDVHHGNGTVDLFKDRPEVLVCSSFQFPHYPYRLFDLERPNLVHSPLDAGSDGTVFRRAIERDWLPALADHRPDIVLVSAGFDAHAADPLGDLRLTESDFAWVTREIVHAARSTAEGRVVSVLEGGYDLAALAASVTAHLEALG